MSLYILWTIFLSKLIVIKVLPMDMCLDNEMWIYNLLSISSYITFICKVQNKWYITCFVEIVHLLCLQEMEIVLWMFCTLNIWYNKDISLTLLLWIHTWDLHFNGVEVLCQWLHVVAFVSINLRIGNWYVWCGQGKTWKVKAW
jgi:hypothetical protein